MQRPAALVVVAGLIVTSATYQWRHFPKMSQELFTREYSAFRTTMVHPKAVYLDQYSSICYYIHTHSWQWTFDHRLGPNELLDGHRVDEFRTQSEQGEKVVVIRDKDTWNFDLMNPETYTTLAAALRDAHEREADLFFIKQLQQPVSPELIAQEDTRIGQLSFAAGLTVTGPSTLDANEAYYHFVLQ
jgi:hypothetical protein